MLGQLSEAQVELVDNNHIFDSVRYIAAVNQVGPNAIQTIKNQPLSLSSSAKRNDLGEYSLICIKNPVKLNGSCHSMILPPYPIISVIQPQDMENTKAHVRHLSPCTRWIINASPKRARNIALAEIEGRYS
jgi:hypothetical protein